MWLLHIVLTCYASTSVCLVDCDYNQAYDFVSYTHHTQHTAHCARVRAHTYTHTHTHILYELLVKAMAHQKIVVHFKTPSLNDLAYRESSLLM